MEKDGLPKLEIDGFASETPPGPETGGAKTPGLLRWAGIAIKPRGKKPRTEKPAADEELKYRRLMIKTGVCAAIAIVILGIASINTPAMNSVADTVGDAVNHEFDIDKDIGRLKFVENLSDDTQSVFSPLPDEMVVYPAEGEVVTAFGQAGSNGIRMDPVDTVIVSMAKGTVEKTGEIDGMGYVKVKLDSGETAYYYNIEPCVKVDDIVKPGQQVGDLVGDYVYVEIKDGDIYVDPVAYIEKWTAPAEE